MTTRPDPRSVPRTDVVIADPVLAVARATLRPDIVRQAVRAAQAQVRDGSLPPRETAAAAAQSLAVGGIRAVLNGTGVILHTNLGRAPLGAAALAAIAAAGGYCDVEYDVETGRRGVRGESVLATLRSRIPLAEGALIVNNGAAALLLAITSLAQGREVIVSRGELVEIGDGFRLPELMESTGARIREVGTTNRTTVADYAGAIGPDTGCMVKIHPSNFVVTGFTASPSVTELAALEVPLIVDIGSGLLEPDPMLADEPDATTTLRAGADLVTSSGDKLLGGPQAGLLMGKATLIERARRHPMARALRVDKLTLAAMEATLRTRQTPTWAALHIDLADLRARSEVVATATGTVVVDSTASVGGGGAPGVELPSLALALPCAWASQLRSGSPAVITRVEHDRCLLDLRCIASDRDHEVITALLACSPAPADR